MPSDVKGDGEDHQGVTFEIEAHLPPRILRTLFEDPERLKALCDDLCREFTRRAFDMAGEESPVLVDKDPAEGQVQH